MWHSKRRKIKFWRTYFLSCSFMLLCWYFCNNDKGRIKILYLSTRGERCNPQRNRSGQDVLCHWIWKPRYRDLGLPCIDMNTRAFSVPTPRLYILELIKTAIIQLSRPFPSVGSVLVKCVSFTPGISIEMFIYHITLIWNAHTHTHIHTHA